MGAVDEVPDPIAQIDWDVVEVAWKRRDEIRMRNQLEPVFGEDGPTRFHALNVALHLPIASDYDDAMSEEQKAEEREGTVTTAIRDLLTSATTLDVVCGAATARLDLAAAYVYLAILAVWELSDRHGVLGSAAVALRAAVDDLEIGDKASPVAVAVARLAEALPFQLKCEGALFCSCPTSMGTNAGSVAEPLERETDADTWRDLNGIAASNDLTQLPELARVVEEERRAVIAYATFLRDVAAPTAADFVATVATRETLDQALAHAECARGDLLRLSSVYASEVAPYLESYHRMKSDLDRESIVIDDGEIVLLYPFGLPRVDTAPHDLARLLLESANGTGAEEQPIAKLREGLNGMPFAVREHITSEMFSEFVLPDDGHEALFGVRLVFPRHQLMLETTAGNTISDLDVEVRISSYGCHVVRFAIATPAGTCWTAHDVDQWVRRGSPDFGTEHLWLESEEACSAKRWDQLADLAGDLVGVLERALEPSGLADERRLNDLRANAHVLVVVRRASKRRSKGEPAPLTNAHDLQNLAGAAALLTRQRSLAATLDDWVRYDCPPVENLLNGRGRPGDLLAVSGDVTVLCAPGSPNWVTTETQHLLEFGVSEIGPLSAWSVHLRRAARRSESTVDKAFRDRNVDRMLDQSAALLRDLGRVRSLLDRLQSQQLLRTHRERELLDQIEAAAGVDELETTLKASIDNIVAQRNYGAAQADRVVEEARRRNARAAGLLIGVIGLASIITFFGWFADGWEWGAHQQKWFAFGVLLVAALVVVGERTDQFAPPRTPPRKVYTSGVALAIVAGIAAAITVGDNRWGWLPADRTLVEYVIWVFAFIIVAYVLYRIWRRPRTRPT